MSHLRSPFNSSRLRCLAAATLYVAAHASATFAQTGIPTLQRHGTATQLVVDGQPFLILGGELGNSSASSMAEFQRSWPRLKALHVNTVVAPVYWELIEPSEGRFNFSTMDSLIAGARVNQMHLVLLWFGTWKNSMSSYVPSYVKLDQARYPRTESTRGQSQEILSPFSATNVAADARVFAALMRHIRDVDGAPHTVLMVQVENETGMIPTARDHSALADSAFGAAVPSALMDYLQRHRATLAPPLRAQWDSAGARTAGTWVQVFGTSLATDELFMAWHFARYHEIVAAAGKKAYPLPMYANAALIRPGYAPGRYVSAGPLPHLIDLWRAASPSTDFIAPDIYFPNFTEWTDGYARSDNPLFIPEAQGSPLAAVNALYAIGTHDAIGFSPFNIDGVDTVASPIASSFALLRQLTPLILAHQGMGTMTGAIPPVAFDGTVDATPQRVQLADAEYALTISFGNPPGPPAATPVNPGAEGQVAAMGSAPALQQTPLPRGCLVIMLAPDEFLVMGVGVIVRFAPANGVGSAGILRVQEGRYEEGRWVGGRWLNGDQTNQGRQLMIGPGQFGMQRVKLYTYH
jgi:beta-galactosidase GanA